MTTKPTSDKRIEAIASLNNKSAWDFMDVEVALTLLREYLANITQLEKRCAELEEERKDWGKAFLNFVRRAIKGGDVE